MKRIYLLLLLIMAALPAALAYDFSAVNTDGVTIYYNIKSGNECEVTHGGTNTYSGDVAIPSTANGYSVTSIGFGAFCNCPNLEYVGFPESITLIDGNAFYGCGSLNHVRLPNALTSIGNEAFSGCSSISYIIIPESVTSIGDGAFGNCTNLSMVNFDAVNCVSMGARRSSFYGCTNLYYVIIGENVQRIPDYAFTDCTALHNFDIPGSVTTIGLEAFSGCSSLYSITIPESVTLIDYYAFSRCASLREVTIQDSAMSILESSKTIYDGAFYGCPSLYRFSGLHASNDGRCLLREGQYLIAFAPADLTSYSIPYSVRAIEPFAFRDCSSLTSIEIPENVMSIGNYAFYGCSALNNIVCHSTDTPSCDSSTFSSGIYNSCTLTVPERALSRYGSTSPWSNFSNIEAIRIVYDFYLNSSRLNLNVGQQSKLRTYYSPYRPDSPTISWSSSDTSVAMVAYDGTVTAVSEGSAVITATDGEYTATCNVKVTAIAVQSLNINETSLEIYVGETASLTAEVLPANATYKTVTWASSNADVATVDANGMITAANGGTATITATCGTLSASCVVTVLIPYQIYFEDTTVSKHDINYVPVFVDHKEDITSFNCDIELPEGVTVCCDNNDKYIVEPGERCTDTHVFATNTVNGKIRIVCYSTRNHLFGQEGALFYLPLNIADNVAEGAKLSVRIINSSMTTGSLEDRPAPDTTALFTVASVIPGDINNDGEYNSTDISLAVEYVLGGTPANGNEAAADVNKDGEINSTDISILVSYVLQNLTIGNRMSAPARNRSFISDEAVYLDVTKPENGRAQWFGLGLSNAPKYTAAQFDLHLPYGLRVADVRAVDGNRQAAFAELADGIVRVVVFSPVNADFEGNRFVEILVENCFGSDADMTVSNIVIVAKEGDYINEYRASGADILFEMSGIEGLDSEQADSHRFNLNGLRTTSSDRGVQIVNGKKVIVKNK